MLLSPGRWFLSSLCFSINSDAVQWKNEKVLKMIENDLKMNENDLATVPRTTAFRGLIQWKVCVPAMVFKQAMYLLGTEPQDFGLYFRKTEMARKGWEWGLQSPALVPVRKQHQERGAAGGMCCCHCLELAAGNGKFKVSFTMH